MSESQIIQELRRQLERQIRLAEQERLRGAEWELQCRALVASRSWRWTAPARAGYRFWRQPRKMARALLPRLVVAVKSAVRQPRKSIATIIDWLDFNGRTRIWKGLRRGWRGSLSGLAHWSSRDLHETNLEGLTTSENPLVSVIIPIYGQSEYTIRCLRSIQCSPPQCAFEVLIIDDCSPDDSLERLARIPGIRIIRNESNLGFLRSCNRAASMARGDYVHFLNNDTEVQPGWLDALVRTFSEFPGCGLVGSKLLNADGTLQEAGGIVWRDGSASNFGRGQDPDHPTFSYAREVDYCSGASIMLPTQLFRDLGGFDELFVPAYCEDTDLALRIRSQGWRVIYQPSSVVIHLEGVTSGRDVSSGVKAYQAINLKKLYDRWQPTLLSHEPAGLLIDRAKDRGVQQRVLLIDLALPTPDRDSASVDAYNLMLLLRDLGCQVTFLPQNDLGFDGKYGRALQRIGVEVLHRPYVRSVSEHLADFGARYEAVFLTRPGVMARQADAVRRHCPHAKIVFQTVDLHFLRMERQAELVNSSEIREKAVAMRELELQLMDRADLVTVVGSQEFDMLQERHGKTNVRLMPYARHVRGVTNGFSDRTGIVFVGGFRHEPNLDAIRWLVDEIMPLVWSKDNTIRLHVVGSDMPDEVRCLARNGVEVHGFVADLDSFMDRRRISLAPLRFGAGIKGKVGHAMSLGVPSVVTQVAAEGMGLTHETDAMIADSPNDFAEAILALYQRADLWQHVSEAGVAFARRSWGAEATQVRLAALLRELGLQTPTRARVPRLYQNPL